MSLRIQRIPCIWQSNQTGAKTERGALFPGWQTRRGTGESGPPVVASQKTCEIGVDQSWFPVWLLLSRIQNKQREWKTGYKEAPGWTWDPYCFNSPTTPILYWVLEINQTGFPIDKECIYLVGPIGATTIPQRMWLPWLLERDTEKVRGPTLDKRHHQAITPQMIQKCLQHRIWK